MKTNIQVFFLLLFFPFSWAQAKPEITQENVDELNREFQVLLDRVDGNITGLISDALVEGLEGATLDLETLSDSVSGLQSNLLETSCGVVDQALEDLAEVIEDHPLEFGLVTGFYDFAGIADDVIDHIRENPEDLFVPGVSVLSGMLSNRSSVSWSWSVEWEDTYIYTRDGGVWGYEVSGTKATIEYLIDYSERWGFPEQASSMSAAIQNQPDGDVVITLTDGNDKPSTLLNTESGFLTICTSAADLVNSARDAHLDVIHNLLPQTGLSIESVGPIEFTNFNVGPGIDFVSAQEMKIEIPHNEKWSILVPITIRTSLSGVSDTFNVDLSLNDFQISLGMELEAFDSGKVDFKRIDGPDLEFELDISSDNTLANAVVDFLSPALDLAVGSVAQGVVGVVDPLFFMAGSVVGPVAAHGELGDIGQDQLDDLLEPARDEFQSLVTHPMDPLGGILTYEKTSPWPDLENIILNIDQKILHQNMRYGVVTEVDMDDVGASALLSWKDAFSDGGPGNPGQISEGSDEQCPEIGNINSGYLRHQDAAVWTGTYLGALAHRYKVLPTSETKELLEHTLRAVEILFEVNDTDSSGKRFLARAAAPKNSPLGKAILCRGKSDFYKNEKVIDGEEWVSYQGGDGVSRDQYIGVMFGLNSVAQMVNDPELKARANTLIEDAVDYLISIDWVITEDHPLGLPTMWAGIGYQKITFLTIANSVVPGKYTSELEAAYKLLDMSWLGATVGILDPVNNFYAQNLFYTNLYSFFMLETDPVRREKMLGAGRVKDFYLGHHNNAYFNMIRASYEAADVRSDLIGQSVEILKRLMERPHRRYLPSTSLDAIAALESVVVDLPRQAKPKDGFRDGDEDGVIDTLPAFPVDPSLREWRDQFFWQGSGFVVESRHDEPERELSGIDISLVYWMMRAEKQDDLAWLVPVLHLLLN